MIGGNNPFLQKLYNKKQNKVGENSIFSAYI
jgi:hypothetical protein